MHPRPGDPSGRRYRRRGGIYLLVAGAAMLVSVIGLASLTLTRVEHRALRTRGEIAQAHLYATSAIEMALTWSKVDSSWRTNYAGTYVPLMPFVFGDGISWAAITEPSGSALNTTGEGPVRITGTGLIGAAADPAATQTFSVTAYQPGLNVLQCAAHAANWVVIDTGSQITVDGGVLSCSQATYNMGTINGDVETQTWYNYGNLNGTATVNAPAKELPGSKAWDYYRAKARQIPLIAVGGKIEKAVLTPTNNPYWSTNTDGVYYIKTTSTDFTIRNCRIIGTLLVEVPTTKRVIIDQGCLWEPARPDYPALLVIGSVNLTMNSTLLEPGTGVNYNPSFAPFNDQSDSDILDSYTSKIQGLIYCINTGNGVVMEKSSRIEGTLLSTNGLEVKDSVTIVADPNLYLNPPIGFRSTKLVPELGTWARVLTSP